MPNSVFVLKNIPRRGTVSVPAWEHHSPNVGMNYSHRGNPYPFSSLEAKCQQLKKQDPDLQMQVGAFWGKYIEWLCHEVLDVSG